MNKLIKLSESHYIICDDSEIKEDDWVTNGVECFLRESMSEYSDDYANRYWQKITQSTQPLELVDWENGTKGKRPAFDKIKPLSLSEVEEAINGYSVEKMAEKETIKNEFNSEKSYVAGFNAHKELVKGKLFTIEDMMEAYRQGEQSRYSRVGEAILESEFKKSLLPKTEWEVEITSEGKLKLL